MKSFDFPVFLKTLSKMSNICLIILFLQKLDINELQKVANEKIKMSYSLYFINVLKFISVL
jgi:hypothetical protein